MKIKEYKIAVFLVLLISYLLLNGCSHYNIKSLRKIKKIAIVQVLVNKKSYNIRQMDYRSIVSNEFKTQEIKDPMQRLLNQTSEIYSSTFLKSKDWQLITEKELIKHKVFKNLIKKINKKIKEKKRTI